MYMEFLPRFAPSIVIQDNAIIKKYVACMNYFQLDNAINKLAAPDANSWGCIKS